MGRPRVARRLQRLWKKSPMRTEPTTRPAAPQVFRQPPSLPDLDPCELSLGSSPFPAPHDATLILSALEELEAQRQAIERLHEADLLRLIVV